MPFSIMTLSRMTFSILKLKLLTFGCSVKKMWTKMRRRDFKLNDTSWNAVQYNDSKQNDVQHFEAKMNDIQLVGKENVDKNEVPQL